eukprot:990316-Pyramimonas_sp.AAC.1
MAQTQPAGIKPKDPNNRQESNPKTPTTSRNQTQRPKQPAGIKPGSPKDVKHLCPDPYTALQSL